MWEIILERGFLNYKELSYTCAEKRLVENYIGEKVMM